ncbi:MAG: hypothetical protein JWP95_2131, partial [Actinotalea sp.]|nr:hypothetical protein [Actinotalea sp.]
AAARASAVAGAVSTPGTGPAAAGPAPFDDEAT